MLKYIGEFDKLKDYGFVGFVLPVYFFGNNDNDIEISEDLTVKITNYYETQDGTLVYEKTDMNIMIKLYDLIKDGLVIKAEQ